MTKSNRYECPVSMLAVVLKKEAARGTRLLCEDLVKRDFLSDDHLAAVGIKTLCLDLVRRKCTVV